jgi:hypothetical protein
VFVLQDKDRFHAIRHSGEVRLADSTTMVLVIFVVRRAAGWFDLAREKVKGNIRLLIDAEDTGNVFVRLRGPRWEEVAWDSSKTGGSIFSGTGQRVRKEMLVPLAKFPAGWVVEVRRQSGAVKIYRIRAEMNVE